MLLKSRWTTHSNIVDSCKCFNFPFYSIFFTLCANRPHFISMMFLVCECTLSHAKCSFPFPIHQTKAKPHKQQCDSKICWFTKPITRWIESDAFGVVELVFFFFFLLPVLLFSSVFWALTQLWQILFVYSTPMCKFTESNGEWAQKNIANFASLFEVLIYLLCSAISCFPSPTFTISIESLWIARTTYILYYAVALF